MKPCRYCRVCEDCQARVLLFKTAIVVLSIAVLSLSFSLITTRHEVRYLRGEIQ